MRRKCKDPVANQAEEEAFSLTLQSGQCSSCVFRRNPFAVGSGRPSLPVGSAGRLTVFDQLTAGPPQAVAEQQNQSHDLEAKNRTFLAKRVELLFAQNQQRCFLPERARWRSAQNRRAATFRQPFDRARCLRSPSAPHLSSSLRISTVPFTTTIINKEPAPSSKMTSPGFTVNTSR